MSWAVPLPGSATELALQGIERQVSEALDLAVAAWPEQELVL